LTQGRRKEKRKGRYQFPRTFFRTLPETVFLRASPDKGPRGGGGKKGEKKRGGGEGKTR